MPMIHGRSIDEAVQVTVECPDGGSELTHGQTISSASGPAIFTAERTALNFCLILSGIATSTASIVNALREYKVKVVCIRNMIPRLPAAKDTAALLAAPMIVSASTTPS
ncbi:hypothetical protein NKJ57_27010 [Mesorhizobium sp. M0077]